VVERVGPILRYRNFTQINLWVFRLILAFSIESLAAAYADASKRKAVQTYLSRVNTGAYIG
jgi:hypothetical protein